MNTSTFTIEELAQTIKDDTGEDLSVRTIRYYITEGILRRPDERGKFSTAHLDRLQLILQLKKAFTPLPEIKQQLALLSDGDVAAQLSRFNEQSRLPSPNIAAEYTQRLLAKRATPAADQRAVPPAQASAPDVRGENWNHITLAPGIELHARQPLSPEAQAYFDALMAYAQTLRPPHN